MAKKRAKWDIKLRQSNYKNHGGKLVAQVVARRTYTLDDLVERMAGRGGNALSRENLRHAALMLMGEIEDCLVEGAAVNLPIGRLSPGLTGTWQEEGRRDAGVRAENTAVVNYAMSGRMRQAVADPVLRELGAGAWRRLRVDSVEDAATGAANRLVRGHEAVVRGDMLLMNGDLPERGIYLGDASGSGFVMHLPAEEVVESTRGRLLFQVPEDLPAGQYYMRVASQCTTNPAPMKSARTYDYPVPLECE